MKEHQQTEINQPTIGILMLDSRFPRILGDVGNPCTWPFPVQYGVVDGATPERVVRGDPSELIGEFVAAGRTLVSKGATGIVTTCGFLSLFQRNLADSLGVPVATSALLQVPSVNALLANSRRAGILTISAQSLKDEHLRAAGVPANTPIGTTEGGKEFTRAILGDEPKLDVGLARQDNISAALALQKAHPHLGAIVLECTNMTPYSADIAAATGLPVFSIETLVTWFHSALQPRRFA